MNGPDRERLLELASLHAVGALTAEERAQLAAAARDGDSAVRDELSQLIATAAALAQGLPQVDPSPALRERILAGVGGKVTPMVRPPAAVPARSAALPAWLATAAALVAAMGLGLWAIQLRGALVEMSTRVAEAEREVTEIRRTLGQERDRVQVLQARADVLFAPDMVRVDLAGQPAAPGSAGRAFLSRRKGMTFAANALPPIPADKVYQVWLLTGTLPPISAGLLNPDREGSALAHFEMPPGVPTPVAVAVTLEPAGGLPQPSGDRILVGQIGN